VQPADANPCRRLDRRLAKGKTSMHGTSSRRFFGLLALVAPAALLAGCSSQAPQFTYRDTGGDIKSIADYDQGVKVLCFTNTWCNPCRDALVAMQEMHEQFADRGVRFVFVSSWREEGDPAAYMEEQGYTFGLMLNGTKVAMEHNVTQLPTFCVLGIDGKVVTRFEGMSSSTTGKVVKAVDKYMRRFEGRMGAPVAGSTNDE
jgi:thiol-disulfide isomerase/thioredoxin